MKTQIQSLEKDIDRLVNDVNIFSIFIIIF